jgi:hypothetical protein
MAKTFSGSDLSNLRSSGYLRLMSGDPAEVATLRTLIKAFKDHGTDFGALDLLDRTKDWIANGEKAKKRAFLRKLHLDAKQYFDAHSLGTWRTMAYCAHVFRYSGRFWKAQKAYSIAFSMIGDIKSHPKDDRMEIADIYADYAEFRAYLGHPAEVDEILADIEHEYERAWHYWVRATAYHFLGYESAQPFGSRDPTNQPGTEEHYIASNTALATARSMTGARKKLPAHQKVDTYLLEAANWGAIHRLKNDPAEKQEAKLKAVEALNTFRHHANADEINKTWSWTKERRGRLAIFYRRKLDGALDRQVVEDWRRKFRNHYRENLQVAELQDRFEPPKDEEVPDSLLDGDLDDQDDHMDDEED